MCNRYDKLNVTHPFTANFLLGHFHTTAVAYDTLVPYPFVFSAVAFPVFYRAKDPFTEQTVPLGLVCSVIDGLRFQHFTA